MNNKFLPTEELSVRYGTVVAAAATVLVLVLRTGTGTGTGSGSGMRETLPRWTSADCGRERGGRGGFSIPGRSEECDASWLHVGRRVEGPRRATNNGDSWEGGLLLFLGWIFGNIFCKPQGVCWAVVGPPIAEMCCLFV